jgi:hypothetical protein
LIRVENKFSLVSVEQLALPPVADEMSIQLTQLKLARYVCVTSLSSLGTRVSLHNSHSLFIPIRRL